MPEPLSFEFVQVYQQQRLGLQFRDALLQMGARVPSRDLGFLITAILVQKETGGDLTEILDRTAHVIRERIRIGRRSPDPHGAGAGLPEDSRLASHRSARADQSCESRLLDAAVSRSGRSESLVRGRNFHLHRSVHDSQVVDVQV